MEFIESFQYLVVGCSCLVQLHILSYIVDDVPCICSQRWILAYITFFGYLLVYVFRNSFSVALVCMTKDDNIYITNNNSNYSNLTQGDCIQDIQKNINNENAEFDWDKTIRSGMLTAFFYGYIITQIPGGWLADRFGSKKVIFIVMLISSISLLILPVCARTTYILVYAIRAVLGIALGMVSPSVTSMWGRWAPPLERSRLTTLPNVGGLTLIWLISSFSVPWRQVFTSRAVWACIIGHVCFNWTDYTLLTSLPVYMKENGALSSVPYIFNAATTFIAGYTADVIRSKHLLNTTRTRKVYQATDTREEHEEWRVVFFVCAGFGVFGSLIFGLFASGELEDWSKDSITKMCELKIDTDMTYLVYVHNDGFWLTLRFSVIC
ncbi:hypothetical protein KUTeg_012820 [Tegillarca granosa]|uniref:Major facilitator superfamily (MFS) profile domain-containing protein n=1 Tax=Tegillarca granosa TaxID=220873 RepID=A0ABQ9F205_TEGGR|nr:hypothetical protein KUTeg_012820 [Tegillarca granosa]